MAAQDWKLVSWNLAGRSRRAGEQIQALQTELPDVVTLQEVTTGSLSILTDGSAEIGLTHIIDSFSLAPNPEELTGKRRYGEIIASRWPVKALPPTEFVPWPERFLSGEIEHPAGEIEIHTTHIPPGSSNGWIKVEMLEGIYRRLACEADHRRILTGDFNTPQSEKRDGTVVTWGQYEEGGEVLMWKRWRGGAGEDWDRGERSVLVGLREFDLTDVYRRLNGYERQESSWYWCGRTPPIGRRFDHVFASKSLNAVECRYVHEWRENGLSDHSGMVVTFTPG